jgi:Lon protease-like protein
MMKPIRIPLFPLDVVLFPQMVLPLHVFEPRYKKMIGLCLDENLEFGMVLATEKTVATVGCTAAVTQKVMEYPDGRMDIITEGRSVFHLNEILQEKEYYEATVEYLEDDSISVIEDPDPKLVEAFEQCHVLLFGEAWTDSEPHDRPTLAYRMAAQLPLPLADKQQLLETRNENDRRQFLLSWLVPFVPELMKRQQARRRAGGNGHGPN